MAKAKKPKNAPDGKGIRLALVTARFNDDLTDTMRERAIQTAKDAGATVTVDLRVPGVFDLPLIVDQALMRSDVDAAVALGTVITGQTGHDVLIAHAAVQSLSQLGLKHAKPVTLGVTGPGQTHAQAQARVDRADAAVHAAVELVRALQSAKKQRA